MWSVLHGASRKVAARNAAGGQSRNDNGKQYIPIGEAWVRGEILSEFGDECQNPALAAFPT